MATNRYVFQYDLTPGDEAGGTGKTQTQQKVFNASSPEAAQKAFDAYVAGTKYDTFSNISLLGQQQQVKISGPGATATRYIIEGEPTPTWNQVVADGNVDSPAERQARLSDPDASDFTKQAVARMGGESIADFTKRLDGGGISQQDYFLKPGETIEAYNARIAQLRSGTTGSSSGGAPGTSSGASTGMSGYSPIVGTSFAERYKELQKELRLGKPPTAPDYFTGEDKARLGTARDERTAIEAELAEILNERLAIDEELQKFGINAGEGTTEAGRIGAVSEAQRNANERLQVLNRRELVLETKLRSRNTVISELMSLQRQEYEDAVEQYNTQFTRAMQLYSIFDEEQDEARAEAKEAKNELKTSAQANLSVLSNVYQAQISSGKITQLSGLQRAKLEELENQAGLPLGSTEAVLSTLKPAEEKLYTSFNEKTGVLQYFYRDAQGNMGIRSSQGSPTSSPTSSGGSSSGGSSSGSGGSVAITPEDRRILTGAGFSTSEISQIVSDVTAYGIDAVLDGVSGSQKTAIQKVFNVTPKITLAQITSSVTQKLAQEGLESAYTTEELEKLAAQYGFASIWKSRETEVQNFLNSSKAKEVYADLLYKQYKDAGQAE